MAALGSQSIASSYEQLLHVDADGGGNSTTHVSVKDGDNGTTFGFTIASDALMMSSTNRLEFGDTGTYIFQSADGVLDLVSDTEIEINATTIDMNGALDLSGNAQLSGTVTVGADGSGTDVIFYSGTAGDNFTWDSSEECLTITGTDGAQALKVADGDLVVVDKIYLSDNDGGEYLSGDGTDLTVTSGNDIKLALGSAGSVHSSGSGGTGNTVLGIDAGIGLEAGSNYNVLIGDLTGDATMDDATNNVGIGYAALGALTTGDNNVAVGFNAGLAISTGYGNTIMGRLAGDALIGGYNNVFLGTQAGSDTTASIGAVMIGQATGGADMTTAAIGSVGVGAQALNALTSGAGNTAIGYQAADTVTTGANNTIVGHSALATANAAAVSNSALGKGALGSASSSTTTGNIAIGAGSLTGGSGNLTNNIAIGDYALDDTAGNAQTGTVAIGYQSLSSLTTGARNLAIGYSAMDALTQGDDNIAIGYGAMGALSTTDASDRNIAIGAYAMDGVSTLAAEDNIFIGHDAGGGTWTSNLSKRNVGIGSYVMDGALNAANYGTAIGYGALGAVTSGDANACFGYGAGGAVADGEYNSLIGTNAGGTISSGSHNVCIGNVADVDTGARAGCIIIGAGLSLNTASDNVVEIGNDTNSMTYDLDGGDITVTSDVRTKRDIQDTKIGLEFINKLRPITYKTKPSSEFPEEFSVEIPSKESSNKVWDGLIAQEVKEVMDEMDVGFSGWEEGINTKQRLAYGKLVMPLIKAVQELSQQVEELKAKVN